MAADDRYSRLAVGWRCDESSVPDSGSNGADGERGRAAARPGQTLIGDKNYYGTAFEATMTSARIRLLRPARQGEPARPGGHLFKPLRQIIESVNDTFKGQLDLEHHGGHTPSGVTVRVLQRILALTAAIWHNDTTGQPTLRSLTAYDH